VIFVVLWAVSMKNVIFRSFKPSLFWYKHGGCVFHQQVSNSVPGYTVSHPKEQYSSNIYWPPLHIPENPWGWFLQHILQQYGQTVWSQNTIAVPYPQRQQFLYYLQLASTLIQQGNAQCCQATTDTDKVILMLN
jgi:hypothetical protein